MAGAVAGGLFIGFGNGFLLLALALALVISIIGLVDDRWPLPAKLRLTFQLAVVSTFVIFSAPPALVSQNVGSIWVAVGTLGLVFAGVWWLNLFNFMDGIDGFAASQALSMLGGAIALLAVQSAGLPSQPLLGLIFVTGAAILGFLVFNWPPAKIFMGDVGSMFLGFLIFAIAILSAKAGWFSLWQWAILGAVFVADASVTLVRRLYLGKNILKAHRSHAYQHLSQSWGGGTDRLR